MTAESCEEGRARKGERAKPTFSERRCEACGEGFVPTGPAQKRCQQCIGANRFSPVERTCRRCGNSFEATGHRREERVYCSTECKAADFAERFMGDGNPHWEGGWPEFTCSRQGCSNTFRAYPDERYSERYCSKACKDEAHSVRMSRENNPHWKGEDAIRHWRSQLEASGEYRRWRLAVFERDRYTCQRCGYAGGGNLEAHHVKQVATHPEMALELDNGQTLCEWCHRLEHGRFGDKTEDQIRAIIEAQLKRGHNRKGRPVGYWFIDDNIRSELHHLAERLGSTPTASDIHRNLSGLETHLQKNGQTVLDLYVRLGMEYHIAKVGRPAKRRASLSA